MSTLGKIVYLSEAQASELFANGSITVDGSTITYSADDLYLTPENIEYVKKSGDTMTGTLTAAAPITSYHSTTPSFAYKTAASGSLIAESAARAGTRQIFFREYASDTAYHEDYLLPEHSTGATGNAIYNIVTTKGSYTMTGELKAPAFVVSNTDIAFVRNDVRGSLIRVPTDTNRFNFYQWKPGSTSVFDMYTLPAVTRESGTATYDIVTTNGSYTMTGSLTAKTLQTYNRGDNYASLSFKNTTTGSDNAAMNCYLSNNRIFITEYSPGTTYVERFYLPAPDSSRTASADYNILTSKSPVTVAQGGTGDTGIVAGTLENVNSNVTVQSETRLRRWGRVVNFSFHITLSANLAAYTPLFYFPTGFRPSEVYNTFLRSAASDTDAAIYKTYTYSAGAYTCRAALPAGSYLGELTMLI